MDPLNYVSNQKYNSPNKKKKFLLKEMVYSFYFHHHKHFEKNSYKVLFNFKYIKWDFLLYS